MQFVYYVIFHNKMSRFRDCNKKKLSRQNPVTTKTINIIFKRLLSITHEFSQ